MVNQIVNQLDVSRSAFAGRTIVMSGGSRGIGLAIATAAGSLGANVVLLAKTDRPHPTLPGTVHTAVEQIESLGGQAIAVVGDVRLEDDVRRAASTAVERFGAIDVVVNNASAIDLSGTEELAPKRFELMTKVNVHGTFLLTQACLPRLRESANAHVLTLSPPLNLSPRWMGAHPGYTVSKYGMTLLSLGWAAEYATEDIGFACLWPETYIATSAVENVVDDGEHLASSRRPEIMADAAIQLLTRPAAQVNAQCFIDAHVLADAGVTDFTVYGGGEHPTPDIFVDQ